MSFADTIADVIGGLLPSLNRWRTTNTGVRNAWTFEGLTNVLRLEKHFLNVLGILGGKPTSCFRSPEVNEAVGGVKDSYHQQGAALDVIGWGRMFPDVDRAAAAVFAEAKAGKIGPVREIIPEHRTGAVHVDWYTRGDSGPPRLVQDSRF